MDDNTVQKLGKKASNITLLVNISLMISKIVVGIISKSTVVIADAFNNGTDIFASIAVYGGIRIAYLPPDRKHNYGHEKAESIVSKIVALIIMATGITIGYSAVNQIILKRSEIPGVLAIGISIVSIFVKFFLFKYTNKTGNLIGSPSLVADSYNHRSDVLASFSALIGVLGARFGFPMLDPIAGFVVAVIIFKTGISIYIEAIDDLMDTAPSQEIMDSILKEVSETEGVINVNELKARKFGPKLRVDLKICVNKDITVQKGHEIASSVKHKLMDDVKGVQDVMVHVNPCPEPGQNSFKCQNCKKRNDHINIE